MRFVAFYILVFFASVQLRAFAQSQGDPASPKVVTSEEIVKALQGTHPREARIPEKIGMLQAEASDLEESLQSIAPLYPSLIPPGTEKREKIGELACAHIPMILATSKSLIQGASAVRLVQTGLVSTPLLVELENRTQRIISETSRIWEGDCKKSSSKTVYLTISMYEARLYFYDIFTRLQEGLNEIIRSKTNAE